MDLKLYFGDFRGAGVGRQLLQHLIERGSSSDIYITTLGSTTGFYEREGFAELQANAIPKCAKFAAQAHLAYLLSF